jgi:hypothetical protein
MKIITEIKNKVRKKTKGKVFNDFPTVPIFYLILSIESEIPPKQLFYLFKRWIVDYNKNTF